MSAELVQHDAPVAGARPLTTGSPVLQRKCACGGTPGPDGECAECKRKRLQRKRAGDAGRGPGVAPPIVHEVLRSSGEPLEPGVRAEMEGRLGHDFSNVRIHTDSRAAESARAVNALAYTVGRHVAFDEGKYQPWTGEGRRLLAHELAHVVQQSGSPAAGTEIEIGSTNAPHEREADAAAAVVGAGGRPTTTRGPGLAVLRRQETEFPTGPAEDARMAAALCDLPSLCSAHFKDPKAVPVTQVRTAVASCRPGHVVAYTNPCLDLSISTPLALVPGLGGPASATPARGGPLVPRRSPAPAGPAPSPLGGLSEALKFEFSAGPVEFMIKLPATIRARLPIELSAAKRLTFQLQAKAADFGFQVSLDGIPHVTLTASAGANPDSGKGKAGLQVTLKKPNAKCFAESPASIRARIKAAGDKLTKAIQTVQKGQTPEGEDAPIAPESAAEIADAISTMYEAVEEAKKPCKERPVVSFGITGEAGPQPDEGKPGRIPWSIMGGVKIHF